MDIKSLYHDTLITVEEIAVGDNEIFTGAGISMKGYEGAAFIVAVGDYEAGTYTFKLQCSTTSAFTDAADLEGSSYTFATITTANTNVKIVDIQRPPEEYVRAILTIPNLTSTTQPAAIIAIRYGARILPQTNTGEFHQSPVEGTA
jgi:hypothetical protein